MLQDLERKLQSGHLLSNSSIFGMVYEMLFDVFPIYLFPQTEQIVQRLDSILSVTGTVAEKQLFITEVILPEVRYRGN